MDVGSDTTRGRLAGIELLSALPPDELRALEQRCRWRRHRAGEQILDRQSESRDLFFVVSGRVRVVVFSASGREVFYAFIEAGDFFGELSAIDGEPRSASVIAVDDCVLCALSSETFNHLLLRHPEVAVAVLRRLTRIIRTSDERIYELTTLGAVQRVHRLLLQLARPDPATPGGWSIVATPTQQSIAAQAGTTRETVARALSQLAGAGVVRRRGRKLVIDDYARLEAMSRGAPGSRDGQPNHGWEDEADGASNAP